MRFERSRALRGCLCFRSTCRLPTQHGCSRGHHLEVSAGRSAAALASNGTSACNACRFSNQVDNVAKSRYGVLQDETILTFTSDKRDKVRHAVCLTSVLACTRCYCLGVFCRDLAISFGKVA